MAKSLQDQLLQAGLINSNKAKKSKSDKRKQLQQQRKNKVAVVDENKLQIAKAKAEKLAKDRALNLKQKQLADQKALLAQVKQLIMMNRQETSEGDVAFNFVDQDVIKTVYLTNTLRDQVAKGRLAIVKLDQQYHLVPSGVAAKISLHDASMVIMVNDRQEADSADNDPYADFQVPDDLMW